MNDISYEWVNLIEKALLNIHKLPSLEEHFPFPWEEASDLLKKTLNVSQFELSCIQSGWKEANKFLEIMGDLPSIVCVELPPIEGYVYFVLPQSDLIELTSYMLLTNEDREGLYNSKLRQGFYHFILLKILNALGQLSIFKNISFRLLPSCYLPQEKCFFLDIQCSLPSRIVQGRILCTQSFLSSVKSYLPFKKKTLLSFDEKHVMDLTLSAEIGYTTLTSQEWNHLKEGDFVLLDRCSFTPSEGKGSMTAYLGPTPLFMARLKPEGFKVLDYAFYEEVYPQHDHLELTHESADMHQIETQPKEEAAYAEDAIDEQLNQMNNTSEVISEQAEPETTYLLRAEIGRFTMSLAQLLKVANGSTLDLPLKPENGVDVVLNGKCVAKAELLHMGETSGLRILELDR
jgi:flagellar motor switch protein FliN/FliY